MFQHVSVKDLPRIKEGMLQVIERLKHVEDVQEINKAYDYVKTNIPELKPGTPEEESKNWLDTMLALKEAGFSFYAAREAADLFALGKDVHFYSGQSELKHTHLPSTWNNEAIKDWRAMDQDRTQEKEAREAKSQEETKQRKADITRAKPPKIQVVMTSAKERQPTPPDLDNLTKQFDQEVWQLLPHGLTDQEIYDRVTGHSGYDALIAAGSDLLKGRIRNLRKLYNDQTQKPEPTQTEKSEPWNKPTVYRKVEIDNINKGLQ
jgi:hypothetical protein